MSERCVWDVLCAINLHKGWTYLTVARVPELLTKVSSLAGTGAARPVARFILLSGHLATPPPAPPDRPCKRPTYRKPSIYRHKETLGNRFRTKCILRSFLEMQFVSELFPQFVWAFKGKLICQLSFNKTDVQVKTLDLCSIIITMLIFFLIYGYFKGDLYKEMSFRNKIEINK